MIQVSAQRKWLYPRSAAMTRFESNAKLCLVNPRTTEIFFFKNCQLGSIDPCVEYEWVFSTQRTSYRIPLI